MEASYRVLFYQGIAMPPSQEINRIVLRCIDEALAKLGGSVKESIYFYLKRDFGLDRSQIPANLTEFHRALNAIFGRRGAKVIEKMILAELENRLKIRVDSKLTLKELSKIISKSNQF